MKCRIFCKCMWIMILWHSQHYAMIWEKILWNLCKNLCKFYANPNLYAFYASARDSLYSSFLAKKNFLLLLVVGHWQSDPHRSSLGDEDWWGFFRSSNEPLLGRPIPAWKLLVQKEKNLNQPFSFTSGVKTIFKIESRNTAVYVILKLKKSLHELRDQNGKSVVVPQNACFPTATNPTCRKLLHEYA